MTILEFRHIEHIRSIFSMSIATVKNVVSALLVTIDCGDSHVPGRVIVMTRLVVDRKFRLKRPHNATPRGTPRGPIGA